MLKIWTLAVLLIFFLCPVHAQSIHGIVKSNFDLPVKGVQVIVDDDVITTTDDQGFFELPAEFELPLVVTFRHDDYVPRHVQVSTREQTYYLEKLPETKKLDEVVVLSNMIKHSRVILPTSQVSGLTIHNYSPSDLVTAVNQTPGVFIQSGAINTNRIVIRGIGSRTLYGTNKIRAYFNGIPITNGVGETSIDGYDPEDLENLEIVKGPKATAYGTNLGGTILLNSVEPVPGDFYLRNSTTLGSYGLFKNTAAANYADDQFSIHLNYDHLQTDGFRENSDYNRNAYLLMARFRPADGNEFNLLVSQINYLAHIPSSIGITDFEEDPGRAAANWKAAEGYEDEKKTLVGLSYSHRFEESFRNTSSFFYTYVDHYEPRPFNILSEISNGFGVRTIFTKTFAFRLGQEAELNFGGEWYYEDYQWKTLENRYEQNNGNGSLEGDLLSDNTEFRKYWNAFISLTLPFTEKLTAQAGLNLNKTNYDFNDEFNAGNASKSATREFDPILAPNLNLIWQFTPAKNVYANISRGFNYPGMEETLTPEGVINPDIGPEKGWNYELGTELFFWKKRLHLNVAAYVMEIKDLLVAERVGEDEYIGRNAGKTRHRGIETAADYTVNVTPELTVSPFFNASFNFDKFVDFKDGENDYSDHDLTGVPDEKLNAGIHLAHSGGFFLHAAWQHVGSMPMNDANTRYNDSWDLLNLKVGYQTGITRNLSVEASGGVNNVTDEKYASSILINATASGNSEPRWYYPGMPRNYYGGIRLKYQL